MDTSASREVFAYLAGAIDSDGTIGIRRRGRIYQERICLKQVTPQVPELLKATFGGSLMLQAPSVTKGRPLWYWEVNNAAAANVARLLEPFLQIKVEQARLLMWLSEHKKSSPLVHASAVESMTGTGSHMIRRKVISDESIAARDHAYLQIKKLNRVGVHED